MKICHEICTQNEYIDTLNLVTELMQNEFSKNPRSDSVWNDIMTLINGLKKVEIVENGRSLPDCVSECGDVKGDLAETSKALSDSVVAEPDKEASLERSSVSNCCTSGSLHVDETSLRRSRRNRQSVVVPPTDYGPKVSKKKHHSLGADISATKNTPPAPDSCNNAIKACKTTEILTEITNDTPSVTDQSVNEAVSDFLPATVPSITNGEQLVITETGSVKKRVKKNKSKLKPKSSMEEHEMILYDADTNTLYSRNTSRAGSECSRRGSSGFSAMDGGLDAFRRITRSMSSEYSRSSFCSTASTVLNDPEHDSLSNSLSGSARNSIVRDSIIAHTNENEDTFHSSQNFIKSEIGGSEPPSVASGQSVHPEETEIVVDSIVNVDTAGAVTKRSDSTMESYVPLELSTEAIPSSCSKSSEDGYKILESLLDKYTASEMEVKENQAISDCDKNACDIQLDVVPHAQELAFDPDASLDTSLTMDFLSIEDNGSNSHSTPVALTLDDLKVASTMASPPMHSEDVESAPTIDLDSTCMRRSTRRASMATSGKFCQTKKKTGKKERKENLSEPMTAKTVSNTTSNETSVQVLETKSVAVPSVDSTPVAYRKLWEIYKSSKENPSGVLTGIDYSVLIVMMMVHEGDCNCPVEKLDELKMCLFEIGATMTDIHAKLQLSTASDESVTDSVVSTKSKKRVHFSEFEAIEPPNDRIPGSWIAIQSVSPLYIRMLQLVSKFKELFSHSLDGLCKQIHCISSMCKSAAGTAAEEYSLETRVFHAVRAFIESESLNGLDTVEELIDRVRDSLNFFLSGFTTHSIGGSLLQYQVSWMLNSVVRSQLRFLFDGEPEFLTANLVACKESVSKRSLLSNAISVSYDGVITAMGTSEVINTTVPRRSTKSTKKTKTNNSVSSLTALQEVVKDMSISVLLTNALHQIYELFHDLFQSRERANNSTSVLLHALDRLKHPQDAIPPCDAYIGPHDGVLKTMNEAMLDRKLFNHWLDDCADGEYKCVIAKVRSLVVVYIVRAAF